MSPEGTALRQATAADIAGIQHVRGAVRENRLVSRVITAMEAGAARRRHLSR